MSGNNEELHLDNGEYNIKYSNQILTITRTPLTNCPSKRGIVHTLT